MNLCHLVLDHAVRLFTDVEIQDAFIDTGGLHGFELLGDLGGVAEQDGIDDSVFFVMFRRISLIFMK